MFTKNIEKIFLFLLFMLCANILCPNELNHQRITPTLSDDINKQDQLEKFDSISQFKHTVLSNCAKTDFKLADKNNNDNDNLPRNVHSSIDRNSRNSHQMKSLNLFTQYLSEIDIFPKCQASDNLCDKSAQQLSNFENETNQDFQNIFEKTRDDKLNVSSQNDSFLITNQNESRDNLVGNLNAMKPSPVSPQDMLSFEEWRSKISEQQDKSKIGIPPEQIVLDSTFNSNVPKVILPINRARNFASHECGAKVVDSNAEANFVNRVLNEQMDEYMLNPCKIKNWFIIELCETIQPQYLEMANFELYSSIPKQFTVYASEHYPNRKEWSSLGNFTASDTRSLQGFKLHNNGFVKYLKIELSSFYGSEHYCPISLIRIFGTSLFDEVERIDNADTKSIEFSNGDDKNAVFEESLQTFSDLDLFGNAKNAVVKVVMKALNFSLVNQILFQGKHFDKDSEENFNIYNQSKIIKLYPFFEQAMISCENYFFPSNTTTNKTLNIPRKCLFHQLLLSDHLFKLMSTQYLIRKYFNNYLFFQCGSNETHFDPKVTEIKKLPFSNNSILTDLSSKFKEETSSLSSQIIEKLNTSFTPNIISNNDPQSLSLTLEPSIPDPLIMQTIMNTLPQHQSIFHSSIPDNIISSISSRSNDSSVIIDHVSTKPEMNLAQSTNSDSESDIQSFSSMSGQSKEAVIIRLTNRIKNLEKNISLMSTYLENLSVRYRKQMEEMQKIFNQTLDHFNTSARIAAEKDMKQQEQILRLQQDILFLNQRFSNVFQEVNQNNWLFLKIHIILMIIEATIVGICCLIFYLSFKRNLLLTEKQKSAKTSNTLTLNKSDTDEISLLAKNDIDWKKVIYHRSKSLSDLRNDQQSFNKFLIFDHSKQVSSNKVSLKLEGKTDSNKENQSSQCDSYQSNCYSPIPTISPNVLKVIENQS